MKAVPQQVQSLHQNVHVKNLRVRRVIQNIKRVTTKNAIITTVVTTTRANVLMNDIHIHRKIGITMPQVHPRNRPTRMNITKRKKIDRVQASRAVAVVQKNSRSKVCVCTRARNNTNPITNVVAIFRAMRNTAKLTSVVVPVPPAKVVQDHQVQDTARDVTIALDRIHRHVPNHLHLLRHAVHHDLISDARTRTINVVNTPVTTNIQKTHHAHPVRLVLLAHRVLAVRAPVQVQAVHRVHQALVGHQVHPVAHHQAQAVVLQAHLVRVHPVRRVRGAHRRQVPAALQAHRALVK